LNESTLRRELRQNTNKDEIISPKVAWCRRNARFRHLGL